MYRLACSSGSDYLRLIERGHFTCQAYQRRRPPLLVHCKDACVMAPQLLHARIGRARFPSSAVGSSTRVSVRQEPQQRFSRLGKHMWWPYAGRPGFGSEAQSQAASKLNFSPKLHSRRSSYMSSRVARCGPQTTKDGIINSFCNVVQAVSFDLAMILTEHYFSKHEPLQDPYFLSIWSR